MKTVQAMQLTRGWHELAMVFVVAALTQLMMVIVNTNTNAVDRWRDWAIAAGVGILQAGARAALAYLVADRTVGTPVPAPAPVTDPAPKP